MSAQDDRPLYHGTWAGWLRKGQLLRPSSDLLGQNLGLRNFKLSSPAHVYVTHNLEDAQWYANLGYDSLKKMDFKLDNIPVHGARPTVYRVEPRGLIDKDPSQDYQDRSSYRIHGPAKILGRQWEG